MFPKGVKGSFKNDGNGPGLETQELFRDPVKLTKIFEARDSIRNIGQN